MQTWWQYFGLPVAIIVAGWAITSALGRALGRWPTIWKAFAGVARAVWRWITYPVPVPLILPVLAVAVAWSRVVLPSPVPAILLAALVVLAALSAWRRHADVSKTRAGTLSEVEKRIVAALVVADGRSLTVDQIAHGWNLRNLVVKNASESLMDRGLLDDYYRNLDICKLTAKGTRFAIENRYVQTAPESSASRHP